MARIRLQRRRDDRAVLANRPRIRANLDQPSRCQNSPLECKRLRHRRHLAGATECRCGQCGRPLLDYSSPADPRGAGQRTARHRRRTRRPGHRARRNTVLRPTGTFDAFRASSWSTRSSRLTERELPAAPGVAASLHDVLVSSPRTRYPLQRVPIIHSPAAASNNPLLLPTPPPRTNGSVENNTSRPATNSGCAPHRSIPARDANNPADRPRQWNNNKCHITTIQGGLITIAYDRSYVIFRDRNGKRLHELQTGRERTFGASAFAPESRISPCNRSPWCS